MKRLILITFGIALVLSTPLSAQQASQNIPVLPVIPELEPDDPDYDPAWYLKGDGYLQRQVEPTIAVSTRNPDHILSFFVDYRAVDVGSDIGLGEETQNFALAMKTTNMMLAGLIPLPEIPFIESPPIAASEAWVGGSSSHDGGMTWSGFFMPGASFDHSVIAEESPVYLLEAATDPVAVAGPCGYVYVAFMAFTRGDQSKLVVARFQDLNDSESGRIWQYQGTWEIESGNNATNGYFLDKPHIALDIFRDDSDFSTYGPNFSADQCGHRVYTSYSTFNGLDKFGKFQSKLNFAASKDAGQTWDKSRIQQPYTQNQGSFIAVDPRPGTPTTGGGGSVYLVWRHFYTPDAIVMIKTTNYGKKWSKPVELTGDIPMQAFDQPTIQTIDNWPNSPREVAFRSNAFPTAAVAPFVADEGADPDDPSDDTVGAALYVAWQEHVDIDPDSKTYEMPKQYDETDDIPSSPRIVMVRWEDGESFWTDIYGYPGERVAVDFGYRDGPCPPGKPNCNPPPGFGALLTPRESGPQVMPWLSFGGGELALAYSESRGMYTRTDFDIEDENGNPIGKKSIWNHEEADLSDNGYISDIDRVMDFRVALLYPDSGQLKETIQVSRYPIRYTAVLDDEDGEGIADVSPVAPELCDPPSGQPPEYCQPSLNFANKNHSGSGHAAFMGDYPGMSPIVQFLYDFNETKQAWEWRWATSPRDVPYQAFHAVFADNRHLIPPTEPELDKEWERYPLYSYPTEETDYACANLGSRNTDVLTAKVNAELVLSAPTTYKQGSTANPDWGYPISVFNQSDETRFYELTIFEGAEYATFVVNPGLLEDPDIDPTSGVVEIFAYSSTSQMVYVDPVAMGQIRIEVTQVEWDEEFGVWVEVDGGERGFVTLNPDPSNPDTNGSEAQKVNIVNEGVDVYEATDWDLDALNPFVRNPFVRNPFVRNPFVRNAAIEDEPDPIIRVIDTTWSLQATGDSGAGSYLPVINIDNAEQFLKNYAFQLLVYKNASHGTFYECESVNVSNTQIISNVSQSPGDTTENPFVRNPSVSNPFVRNPFVRNPFVRNSAFTMAPADGVVEEQPGVIQTSSKNLSIDEDGNLRAPRVPEKIYITLRAFQLHELDPDDPLDPNDPFDLEYRPDIDDPAFSSVPTSCTSSACIKSLAPDLRLELTEPEPDTYVPTISGVPEPPEAIIAGTPFAVDWTLENVGNVSADAENRNLRHGFYISNDETVRLGLDDQPTDGDILVGEVESLQNTLPPGATESFSGVMLTVPRDADPDYFKYLVLFVDDYREISEVNEPNNQHAMPIIIEAPADEFFDGFFVPWTESPQYTVNAGSAIPLKWRYRDPETELVVNSEAFAPTIEAKRLDSCQPLDPSGPGETTVITENPDDPGTSDLRYSPSSGTWQFNWETDPTKPGCYYLRVVNEVTGISEPLLVILE